MRLDKFITHALGIHRKDARDEIKAKRVKVNGEVVTKNDFYVDCYKDKLEYKGSPIIYKEFIYIMLNKPSGVITATKDAKYTTVCDLLPDEFKKYNPVPVGRLDIDTEGFILLTNDGSLTHHITSPNKNVYKKYYLEADSDFTQDDVEEFYRGFELYDGKGEPYITKNAILEIIEANKAYISITEGKYHQIKKMCMHVGKTCTYLKRVEMKGIKLDETLEKGKCRELNEEEMAKLLEGRKL